MSSTRPASVLSRRKRPSESRSDASRARTESTVRHHLAACRAIMPPSHDRPTRASGSAHPVEQRVTSRACATSRGPGARRVQERAERPLRALELRGQHLHVADDRRQLPAADADPAAAPSTSAWACVVTVSPSPDLLGAHGAGRQVHHRRADDEPPAGSAPPHRDGCRPVLREHHHLDLEPARRVGLRRTEGDARPSRSSGRSATPPIPPGCPAPRRRMRAAAGGVAVQCTHAR